MANPPIQSITFPNGTAVVKTADGKTQYTFPLAGINGAPVATPPTVVIDDSSAVAALGVKLDKVLAALAAAPASGGTPTEPTPTSDPNDLHATLQDKLVADGTTTLPAGTFINGLHLGVNQTIRGAGMRKTIIDGRGGVGAGFRLVYGKAIFHVACDNAEISDIGFINAGGADGNSDGEAAIWLGDVTTPINAAVRRCAFDGGENGVFAVPGTKGSLLLEDCVWGRKAGTGVSDGRSHDFYLGIANVIVRRGRFRGNSNGNTMKLRADTFLVEDSYVGRGDLGRSGRFLDLPGGTDVTSNRNLYVSIPGVSGGNAFGFYDENDAGPNGNKPGSFVSTDDTFIATSGRDEVFWINRADTVVSFTRPTVKWIGPKGSAPPRMTIQGPGQIAGPNPFVYDESNRIDAPPPMPDDPVMPS